jgi:hypothetical protein
MSGQLEEAAPSNAQERKEDRQSDCRASRTRQLPKYHREQPALISFQQSCPEETMVVKKIAQLVDKTEETQLAANPPFNKVVSTAFLVL